MTNPDRTPNLRPALRLVKAPRPDPDLIAWLDWHLRGLRDHLAALGMSAEAAAVQHDLDVVAQLAQ
jgi:hypothetical protein